MATVIEPRQCRKNPILVPGVRRFGRSKMYHKLGLFVKKFIKNPRKVVGSLPVFVEKPIGGNANGSKRMVLLKKSKKYHPTATSRRGTSKSSTKNSRNSNCKPKLRGSLKPGTVLILLAGRHAGKRVIFLKQLQSGLLLVTGPFKLNGVPLRRVNQQYVIATSTRLDMSGMLLPGKLNDSYFRRDKKAVNKIRRQQQGQIFASGKNEYEISDERKLLQKEVDTQVIAIMKSNEEKKMLFTYMATPFSLKSGQYPHRMKF